MLALEALLGAFSLSIITYIVYERFFHPLAHFPGPFWASITNFWRFYHELQGDLPRVINEYHKKYGEFVRVAPNEVDTNAADVVDVVYKKGGRHYVKTDFYDGFTAVRPNVFGTRDEALHALRRRQMAHAFSQASLVKMEYIFDRNVQNLIDKLDKHAATGKPFDIKKVLQYFSEDTNGDLSLGILFNTQIKDGPPALPHLNDHIALAKLTGYVPWLKPYFDKYGKHLPWPYLQRLIASRAQLRQQAEAVTDLEFERVGRDDATLHPPTTSLHSATDDDSRFNLFTALVRATDPATGAPISRADIVSNALTFLTAGSHSTTSTLEILFWYLLHHPAHTRPCVSELLSAFPSPTPAQPILPFSGLEARLPHLSALFAEAFRLSPTFQHPAPRTAPSHRATLIAGTPIPPGAAVSASVYALHRAPAIWGPDAERFDPGRWEDGRAKGKEGVLMHFGAGHRACIGRNQSLIMLWKAVVEVLRRFEVRLADGEGVEGEEEPELRVTGFAELEGSLEVVVERRKGVEG